MTGSTIASESVRIPDAAPSTKNEDSLPARDKLQRASSPEPERCLRTVLLVEDDRELADALALRFQHAGLVVARANDGPSGLERFRMLEPGLIILDLRLPRMNGDRFLQFLRRTPAYRDVPIIVITGTSDDALLAKVNTCGVTRVFRKPISPKELLRAAIEVLDE